MTAMAAMPSDTDALTWPPVRHALANRVDGSNNLMSGTRGYWMPGNAPSFVKASLWQNSAAWTLIRTRPGAGSGMGRSTSSNGPLAHVT